MYNCTSLFSSASPSNMLNWRKGTLIVLIQHICSSLTCCRRP